VHKPIKNKIQLNSNEKSMESYNIMNRDYDKIETSREMPSGFLWDSLGGRDFFSIEDGNEVLCNPSISFASI
jgi:hypothetical protein